MLVESAPAWCKGHLTEHAPGHEVGDGGPERSRGGCDSDERCGCLDLEDDPVTCEVGDALDLSGKGGAEGRSAAEYPDRPEQEQGDVEIAGYADLQRQLRCCRCAQRLQRVRTRRSTSS